MDKHCPSCNTTKSVDDFCVRSKSKDGRQPWCKICTTKHFKGYYKENPDAYRARAKKIELEARTYVREQKDNQPCMDCGKLFPHYVLDYDHRDPAAKHSEVLKRCAAGIDQVRKEMSKCDLVCANCHRFRTYKHLPTKWAP